MSPANDIYQGSNEIRSRLDSGTAKKEYPLFMELRLDGITEYIAWPLDHTFGKRHVVTFATTDPGGFDEMHVRFLRDLIPVLALVTEIRVKNILARTLLETYVGPHASEQVLAGASRR